MNKILGAIVCCLILLGLSGCSSLQSSEYEYWGSFTNGPVISSDGLYRAEHAATKQDGSNVSVIQVNVTITTQTSSLTVFILPAHGISGAYAWKMVRTGFGFSRRTLVRIAMNERMATGC